MRPVVDPVPPEPLSIADPTFTADSSAVHVTWQTNVASIAEAAEGLGAEPTVWLAPDPSSVPADQHETDFTGLDPATTYHLWLRATDEWGRTTTLEVTATTAALDGPTPASVNGSAIFVAGRPFFPIAVWDECTNFVPARIAVGINLFMSEGCGRETKLAALLHGRAYAVVDGQGDPAEKPGVIGWYYEDELDGQQSAPLTVSDIGRMKISPPSGMLSFLTLTNHFYSGAAPLWFGRSLYPAFTALANVVGFDLYPLQNWCRSDKLGEVYDAQHELVALAQGKPTFQWIEVRQMDCSSALAPTPQTVTAETWLAIAGGATGIGYFPHDWPTAIGTEIRSIDEQIGELKPALLAAPGSSDAAAPLKVGVRALNGALYVIAVNPTLSEVDNGTIHVDGSGTRTFDVLDEGRTVDASDDVITDTFAPLAVHIYVSAPDSWTPGYLPP
jgi:hypothetical protein